MRRSPPRAWLLASLVVAACGTPPHKEMDQAQGAIDAARAAGADRYASGEYEAATTALKLANERGDCIDATVAIRDATYRFQFSCVGQLFDDLGNETETEWQFFAIDRDTRVLRLCQKPARNQRLAFVAGPP